MSDWQETLVRAEGVLAVLLPGCIWAGWWLWAVHWKNLWPVLACGGWAPAALLFIVAAVVWSRVDPAPCRCTGIVLPNFVWQFGCMSVLAAVALFCGWLQGRLGCGPAEVSVELPVAAPAGHGHHH